MFVMQRFCLRTHRDDQSHTLQLRQCRDQPRDYSERTMGLSFLFCIALDDVLYKKLQPLPIQPSVAWGGIIDSRRFLWAGF